jgi:quinol monooxygenase YgiN
MAELTVIARAKARPGHEADLERAMRAVVGPSHDEQGCLRYTVHRSIGDPASFVTVERWVSKEAMDLHFSAPHTQTLLKRIPELLAEPPDISVFELLPEGRSEKGRL